MRILDSITLLAVGITVLLGFYEGEMKRAQDEPPKDHDAEVSWSVSNALEYFYFVLICKKRITEVGGLIFMLNGI